MSQLTIRLGDELDAVIRKQAHKQGLSLNKMVLQLLRRGVGLQQPDMPNVIGTGLDDLIGSWSPDQAEQMRRATSMFEQIDEEMWR